MTTLVPAAEAVPPRCAALVALGRIDEAEALNAPLEPWLRGLDLSRNAGREPAVAGAILRLFEDSLNPVDRPRFIAIRERIATPQGDLSGRPCRRSR